jgi:arylsulfatase
MRKGNLDIELYNIADDIGEQRDVAAQHPDVVDRLAKLMAQEHTRSEKFPLKPID